MVISLFRLAFVRFALVGLVCAGVIGGMSAAAPSADAKPMSCIEVLAAGDDAASAAWGYWRAGNYQLAQVYSNRADRYYSYYDARC